MPKIDWTKPVELNDGTPVIATDSGQKYHVEIRTTKPHSAFPIGRTKGDARRDTGLVTSNHRYSVRNVTKRTIDLTFQTLDTVTCTEFPGTWQIEKIEGPYYTLKNTKGETAGNLQAKHLRFACHNHNAPFLTISADHDRDFADGYQSGLAIGLTGDYYQAGGPGGIALHNNHRCRHTKEHDEIDEQRAKSWKQGWRKGQEDARTHKVDWSKPIEALGRDGAAFPASVTRWLTPASVEVFIEGKTHTMNLLGGLMPKDFDWVVRNKTQLQRTGYAVFGQGHTSLFDTLEEVSEHWWKTRPGAPANGQFIMRVDQVRDTGHAPWTTISTSGPIDPLPPPPKVEVHYQYASHGYVTASPWTTEAEARKHALDGVVKVTRTDGKVTNVEFIP